MNAEISDIDQSRPSVETLRNRRFFIPSFQRGYRWSPAEVNDLLEDIQSFAAQNEPGSGTWYCLQPLVVRPTGDGAFEVIDGQQRLTTIFLILKYLSEAHPEEVDAAVIPLTYGSRPETEQFFKDLRIQQDGTVAINRKNIDYAHISLAYEKITKWFSERTESDRSRFIAAFRTKVRVIWHEPTDSDGIKIFTRINKGKIPLTNSELIKALFLRNARSNISTTSAKNDEKIRLKQREISNAWDSMEASLQNDAFWYFLSGQNQPPETRIDLIFELLTDVNPDGDAYAVFRKYSDQLSADSTNDGISEKWAEVAQCYQVLEDWFHDWEQYHKIGYLIATGTKIRELFQENMKQKKSEFRVEINRRIRATLPEDLDSLSYGDSTLKNVLLLHNILTLFDLHERHTRFPFDQYKKQKWDVEHIHSVMEKMPEKEKHQRDWLKETKLFIHSETTPGQANKEETVDLSRDIDSLFESEEWDTDRFSRLHERILLYFSDSGTPDDINDFGNLALLDAGTNRGYGNAVFPAKRAKIIERERAGLFVPLCTKNVFLKFYSNNVDNFTFWSSTDREHYKENIETILSRYLFANKRTTKND